MINYVVTFSWTFNDLFVIVISVNLAEKFERINKKIEEASNLKVIKTNFFK